MGASEQKVMDKTTTRCPTCRLGFVDIENLSAAKRLNDHLGRSHRHKCYECNSKFLSDIHLQFHIKYSHDTPCTHCETYCGDRCSEVLGESMCKNERNKVAKAEIIAGLEEEITNKVKMRISVCDEFKNGLKQITGMLDRGYSDESLAKLCSWIYLPTPKVSLKTAEHQVEAWIILESYEAAIERQLEDAKEVQMMRCEYRSCGFLFFNDSQVKLHYWQMHSEYVNPGMNQINISHEEEAEVRHPEVQRSDAKSDLSVGNHPGKPLDYQESSQESRTDQTREASVRNHSYSSMGQEEKIETKHLSTKKTQVETVLTVKYQSKESLEIHKPSMGEMTDELGVFVNNEVEQANDTCEPSTFANNEIVTDMIQGDKVKGTYTDIKRSYKVSNPLVENHSRKPLDYQESSQENRTDQTEEASVRNHSYSSMGREEKIETKHLSTKKTQAETVLMVNYHSKELNS